MSALINAEHAADPVSGAGLLRSGGESMLAFARLFDAELTSAGAALIRLLLITLLAAALLVMLASLLVGAMVASGLALGLSWGASLAIEALLVAVAATGCALQAHSLLRQCSLPVSRRELGRIFDHGSETS